MNISKLVIMIVVGTLLLFAMYKFDAKRYHKFDARLTNHVRFSGEVISLDVSRNHAYGVIGIKVDGANITAFNDSVKSAVFPYKIRNGYAEFYGYVPIEAKVGFRAVLDSDKRILNIYDHDKLVTRSGIAISFEDDNVEFVRRTAKFNVK